MNQHYQILMDDGLFELDCGNVADAERIFREAAKGEPKLSGPIVGLALAALKRGDRAAAMERLADALRLEANDPLPRLLLAELEALGENYQNSAVGTAKILAGLPNDFAAQLANLQYRDCGGELPPAVAELTAFVRRTGRYGNMAKAVADLLRKVDKPAEAEAVEALA